MEQLVAQLTQFWRGLSALQKLIVGGIPLLLLIGAMVAIVFVITASPAKAPLFANLEIPDAARIVAELKKQNIEYDLANDGKDILVSADKVYETRLAMAGKGLPQGTLGFELFDKSKLGITETGMKVDYQRALQGELARTLEAMQQVEQATVLLNISPETSFLDSDTHSTASVALSLKPGMMLSKPQIEGIRHFVSHAVSRLASNDVSIVDGAGNPLTGDDEGESASMLAGLAATDLQARFRSRVERDLEDKIKKILEGPYGAGKVSPSVTVEIDFRAAHNESETYSPVTGDQGIEKHVEEHREKSNSNSPDGGVPGTTSNIPGYLGISAGGEQSTTESKYDLIVDYLVNKQVSLEDLPPGTITRRSAAVALSTDTWDANAKQSVEALVASAIGADIANKKDSVMVQAFQFADTGAAAALTSLAAEQSARNISKLAGWAIAVLMVLALMFMLRALVSGGLQKDALALAAIGAAGQKSEGFELRAAAEEEEFALKRLDEMGATQQERMRQEIDRMIDKSPQTVMALLRSWMLED